MRHRLKGISGENRDTPFANSFMRKLYNAIFASGKIMEEIAKQPTEERKGKNPLKIIFSGERRLDILALAVLFLLSAIFFHKFIGIQTLMDNGHHLHEQSFFAINYKIAQEAGTLPLWTPYWYGGQPLFGDGQVYFLNLTHIFLMLFGIIPLAIDLSVLLYFFLGLAGMYVLGKHLFDNRLGAFVSALVFMFNGLIYQFIVSGNPSILEPYALMPWILLCVLKAKKEENFIPFSLGAGILLALQVFSGGAIMFVYTLMLVGGYLAFDLLKGNFKKNAIRTALVSALLLAVFFGIAAIKILPSSDFISQSNRASGVSYEEYIGGDHFVFSDFFKIIVIKGESTSHPIHIGIAASLLVLLSLFYWRKRMVMFLLLLSGFIVVLSSGGFLAELFYRYAPVFPQTRHIIRVMFVFVFCASLLSGYGFSFFLDFLKRKFHWAAKGSVQMGVVFLISLAILTELLFMKGLPQGFNVKDQLLQNEAAKFMQQQPGFFRITTFDVDDIISFYGSSYYAQYGLETLNGGGSLWSNDYVSFLGIAKNYGSSKMLGMLNLKYALSTKPVNVSGFSLVLKFPECEPCKKVGWTTWIAGPYLYENLDFLPRSYMVDNALLIVGDENDAKQLSYLLFLDPNFNPRNTVIVSVPGPVNRYDSSFLSPFKAVLLVRGSVEGGSVGALADFEEKGGMVIPDVLLGKSALEQGDMDRLLGSLTGELKEVEAKRPSPNEMEVFAAEPGILVLSEKFSLFDDWHARQDGKELDILRADTVISAIIVDSPGTIRFGYEPASFTRGALISSVTLLIIFIYAGRLLHRKWAKKRE